MLITEFESQKENLTELDLWTSWQCLERMERDQERWLAFYNCGEFSGARLTPFKPFIPCLIGMLIYLVNNINMFNSFRYLRRRNSLPFQIISLIPGRKGLPLFPFNISFPL